MSKYVVSLTYEVDVTIEYADGEGRDWELAAALEAESVMSQANLNLTDYTVKLASARDTRTAQNV